MEQNLKRVVVTGGAGQIAYSLLFLIARGELLGHNQPLALHILEIPEMLKPLEGIKMELQDCAFPLLKEIIIGSDPFKIFEGATHAFLVGAKPRGPGMERGDLLKENGKIFVTQGRALDKSADRNVKILVVGNPCNTNCLIALQNAPGLPQRNFHAMTRLDQNRAVFFLSEKAKVNVQEVTNMTIWGNHSSTQVPDFINAKIKEKPVLEVIKDRSWLENSFIGLVQKRGAAIIAARGKSSSASAAWAALQAMKSIISPTEKSSWYSSGIISNENPYRIEPNLIYSFPCRTLEDGTIEIVSHLEIPPFLRNKLEISQRELIEEKDLVFKI